MRPDVVFHLAAQIAVRRSLDEPAFDAPLNVAGSAAVLEAARRVGVRRVVLASMAGVYGNPRTIPTPELAAPAPLPLRRQQGRRRVLPGAVRARARALHAGAPDGERVRAAAGPHGEAGVVAIFAAAAAAGRPVTIFGDGRQTRDYIHVSDVVAAFVTAGRARVTAILNVATGRETPSWASPRRWASPSSTYPGGRARSRVRAWTPRRRAAGSAGVRARSSARACAARTELRAGLREMLEPVAAGWLS